jgi:hypothetical protein
MIQTLFKVTITVALILSGTAYAASVSVVSSTNGLTDIYSATFDGGMVAPADPFFGGTRPPTMNIQVTTPTGTTAAVPGGITGAGSGSFLDLTLGNSNTELTLAGGTVTFPALTIVVTPGAASETTVEVVNSGMVLLSALGTPSLPLTVADADDGLSDGSFTFDVGDVFGTLFQPTIADFSTFADVVTGCTEVNPGSGFCGALGTLNLDMERYRLIISYDGSFSSFTGDFQGQTNNNSMVFATLDSAVVPVPAAVWLFGSGLGLLGWFRRRNA